MIYSDGTEDDEYGMLADFVNRSLVGMAEHGRMGPFVIISTWDLGYTEIEGIPVTVDERIESGSILVMTESDYRDIQGEIAAAGRGYMLTEEQEAAARWN